jgi:uncharacterized protein YciI
MRTMLLVALIAVIVPLSSEAQTAPPATQAVQLPPGMAQYFFVILKRGPAWTSEVTPETTKVSQGHMANLDRLAKEGKLIVAGPFMEPIGNPVMAGILILRVATAAEARALVESDPGVKAGRFTYEMAPWLGSSTLRAD